MVKLILIVLCRFQWALGGAGLLAAAITLRWAGDAKSQAGWTVGILLCSTLFYLISVQSVLTKGPRAIGLAGCGWIATVAVTVRLLLLAQGPTLSEDLFRYRWEGRVQESGLNPYFFAPSDPGTAFLRDGTSPQITAGMFARGTVRSGKSLSGKPFGWRHGPPPGASPDNCCG